MPQSPYTPEFLAQQFPHLSHFTYIASGGQKAVYAVHHQHLGKIALKILTPGASTERFDREVAAVRQLPGNHVPAVFEYGQLPAPHQNHLWLTEQWIDGVSLRDKLQSGPLSNSLILQISFDVLGVLVAAESQKIVHRDIKPDNILIAPDETKSWLIDFGIARHLDKTSLTAAFMPHTIGYAPLEQLNAHKHEIDSRSDIFSLGVTIFECVEGLNPYVAGAANSAEVVRRMENMILPDLSRQVDAKGQLQDLVAAMTRPQRNHRIGSAADAYEWMKEIMDAGAA